MFTRRFSPGASFIRSTAMPTLVTLAGLAGLTTALVAAQMLMRSPYLPDLSGMALMLVGLLPTAITIGLPIAALIGTTTVARGWFDNGEWIALAASGVSKRSLLGWLLLWGCSLTTVDLVMTQWLEPMGRGSTRAVLQGAAGNVRLQPGLPSILGDTLMRAEQRGVTENSYSQLFVASGAWVLSAQTGHFFPGAELHVRDGTIVQSASDENSNWNLSFQEAVIQIPTPTNRVELTQRLGPDLKQLIQQMKAKGRTANAEEMALAKRSIQPLSIIWLVLLGVPLGVRRLPPGPTAVGVAIAWWVVMRLCDQFVEQLGPLMAASIPTLLIALLTCAAWTRWGDR